MHLDFYFLYSKARRFLKINPKKQSEVSLFLAIILSKSGRSARLLAPEAHVNVNIIILFRVPSSVKYLQLDSSIYQVAFGGFYTPSTNYLVYIGNHFIPQTSQLRVSLRWLIMPKFQLMILYVDGILSKVCCFSLHEIEPPS